MYLWELDVDKNHIRTFRGKSLHSSVKLELEHYLFKENVFKHFLFKENVFKNSVYSTETF